MFLHAFFDNTWPRATISILLYVIDDIQTAASSLFFLSPAV